MRYRILPYKQGSRSAKALANSLGGKVLKLQGSVFEPKPDDVVINWGGTNPAAVHWPGFYPKTILNLPNQVRQASNKLTFFQTMVSEGVESLPRFWTSLSDIPDGTKAVARTVLAGHSGEGIVIGVKGQDDLPEASLYTEYLKKKDEYRVHLGKRNHDGETVEIAIQRKARSLDCPDPNWEVRNHANGFVYVRQDVVAPACVVAAATACFEASGLDFGAVDVIYNQQQQRAYVLEINTAPGLEGQTVTDYADFFKGVGVGGA